MARFHFFRRAFPTLSRWDPVGVQRFHTGPLFFSKSNSYRGGCPICLQNSLTSFFTSIIQSSRSTITWLKRAKSVLVSISPQVHGGQVLNYDKSSPIIGR